MKTEIDIYADNPVVTLEYKIAVMQAAASGKKIQGQSHRGHLGWLPVPQPQWNWPNCTYRVDPTEKPVPPKIAEGHNPSKLTEEQVGVKDGWRLLTPDELRYRYSIDPKGKTPQSSIVHWLIGLKLWGEAPMSGCLSHLTYRTKKPVGFFLPPKKKRVPLTLEDIGTTSWMNFTGSPANLMVIAVYGTAMGHSARVGVMFDGAFTQLRLPDLVDSSWRYSTDGCKTWKPCYKEVDELPSSNS